MKTTPGQINYRQHNGYDQKAASDEAVAPQDPISLTVQAQAEDADINVLMKRYGITGKFPDNPRVPTYGDFTGVSDYRTAMQAIRNAQEAFAEYPADFRARFQNDPQLFMEFVDNDQNRLEAEKLGLVKPRPAENAPPPRYPRSDPPSRGEIRPGRKSHLAPFTSSKRRGPRNISCSSPDPGI